MTAAALIRQDGLGRWCGWVLAGLAALTPLMAWLAPLGFAPLLALAGLLTLPALRISEDERPLAILLLITLAWAAASSFWSPFRPGDVEESVALKLGLQIPLYWSAWQAAKRVTPTARVQVLKAFAWGLALLGAVLVVEAITGAWIYRTGRDLLGDPIRPDLARKNVAQASFILVLLWPVATAGGVRGGAPWWLTLPMMAGAGLLAWMFLSDAPVLALVAALLVGLAVWQWPYRAPTLFAALAAAIILLMPFVILVLVTPEIAAGVQTSWGERLKYWTYAAARIADRPLMGWGLDASRTFSPNIQLHPHNGALQLWLELGIAGALAAAIFWGLMFRRLRRLSSNLIASATAASCAVYLLYGAVSFGVWQEWWLALGALVAVISALAAGVEPARQTQDHRPDAVP